MILGYSALNINKNPTCKGRIFRFPITEINKTKHILMQLQKLLSLRDNVTLTFSKFDIFSLKGLFIEIKIIFQYLEINNEKYLQRN